MEKYNLDTSSSIEALERTGLSNQHFTFALVPGFSLVAFSCAIDALRGANLILDRAFYGWEAVSPQGEPVLSSSDIAVPTIATGACGKPDVIAICGGVRSHNYKSIELDNWLHDCAKQGCRIGSISDGAFIAAEAGLFDSVPSTIHWRCQDAYRERFPDLDIRASMMEITGTRFSCAGGTSSLDLMLHFIRETHGNDLVGMIAQNFFHDTVRDGTRDQHLTNAYRMAGANPVLSEAVLMMEMHLEDRVSIEEIARRVGKSRRQLDRIFQRGMGRSAQSFYLGLRLTRAAALLTQTGMSVSEIAVGCGFQSSSHLGRYFKENFGKTPGAYRRDAYQVAA